MKDAAIGIIFNHDQSQVLLVKRQDIPIWVLPGGGIDFGETPEAAVIREIAEETGLKVEIMRKIAEYSPINKLARLTHVFECQIIKGSLQISEETDDIAFFVISHPPHNFFFLHREWLEDAAKNESEPIKRSLTSINYTALIKYAITHPLWFIRFLMTLIRSWFKETRYAKDKK